MKEQMRAEFEAWAKDYSGDFDFTTTPGGAYIDQITYGAWIGYRAGLAALSAVPANNPWQQAIDDELVNAHLGIAQDGVTREKAKEKLNILIAWHVDVAKYFDAIAQEPAQEPLITVESSLRFKIECEKSKSESLHQEVLELKEKLNAITQQSAQEPLQKQLEEITRRYDQQVRINKRLIKAWKEAQQSVKQESTP
jgi:hypothetical protein